MEQKYSKCFWFFFKKNKPIYYFYLKILVCQNNLREILINLSMQIMCVNLNQRFPILSL